MGLLNAACSFTRFRIVDEVPSELWGHISSKLQQFAFRDIDNTSEERAWGWTCFEDMLDPLWHTAPPQKGEYLIFSLRLDTRRVPAGVIKKYVTLALREEKTRNESVGKTFVSRERKKELKEQVLLKLRQRFLPVPAEFSVVWSTTSSTVWFTSTQSKMIDLFTEHFTQTFNLHLEQLTPFDLALSLLDEQTAAGLDYLEATQFASE